MIVGFLWICSDTLVIEVDFFWQMSLSVGLTLKYNAALQSSFAMTLTAFILANSRTTLGIVAVVLQGVSSIYGLASV